MSLRIGMSSAAFYGLRETEEAAKVLASFDLEACEIFLETFSEYAATFGRQVQEGLQGLPCVSVHPKGTQFEPDIFGKSLRQHRDALTLFAHVCQAGQALGAKYYVFHGPGAVRGVLSPGLLYHTVEILGEMQRIAHAHGLEVLWENVSWASLRTPEDVLWVREHLPQQGFVLDLKQAHQVGVDPFALAEAMGDKLRHLHALDWQENGTLTLPGEGVMDFPRLFRLLRAVGYRGAVILEPYSTPEGEWERLARSLAYLRRCKEEAGA